MFVDAATRAISLNSSLVKGSHGAPPQDEKQYGAVLTSCPGILNDDTFLKDTEIHELCMRVLRGS